MREPRFASSVVVSTDEPVFELGLHVLFASDSNFAITCVCRSEELAEAAAKHQPDLILCSIAFDGEFDMVPELRAAAPRSAIILWSREFPVELARQAIDFGVRGFLSTTSNAETIRDCLRAVAGGGMWMERSLSMTLLNVQPLKLSRRQKQLIGLLVQGLRNKEIAAMLGISEGTVKAYLTTLYERVGAKCRFELALFGLRNMRHLESGVDLASGMPERVALRAGRTGNRRATT